MNKHEIEMGISEGITNMNLSHRKELLPCIFELLELKEYYEVFDTLDDGFYAETNEGEESLSYHNKVHAQAVALNCYEALHHTVQTISIEEKKSILLAALFHDAMHKRGGLPDFYNIGYAVETLQDVHKYVKYKVTSKILNKAIKLIRYTQYPYVAKSAHIRDYSARVIRDADLMMVYEPDTTSIDLHVGLFNEFNHARYWDGEEGVAFDYFIARNAEFMQKIEWNTRWARNKAFMLNFPQRIKDLTKKLSELNLVAV